MMFLLLLACSHTYTDAGSDAVVVEPYDITPGVLWSEYTVELRLGLDIGEYRFGMAGEENTAEDCLEGSLCHEGEGDRMSLLYGASTEGLATGSATTFTSSQDAEQVTYIVEDDQGYCYTWGHSPIYYPDCVEI